MLRNIITSKLKALGKTYKTTGDGFIMCTCLNPSHKEKNASFSINLENGVGFCFSCGFRLDRKYWLDNIIDDEQILEIEREGRFNEIKSKLNKKDKRVNVDVILPPKGDSIDEILENDKYRGIDRKLLDELGVYICRSGKYKDRLIFPFYEEDTPITFSTRALNGQSPKYLHSKGFNAKAVIYPKPIDSDYVVIVEGIFDAIAMQQDKINAICNFGVSINMDKSKIKRLLQTGVDTIYMALDKDTAGGVATERFLKDDTLQEYFNVRHAKELHALQRYYESNYKDYNDFIMGA